MSAVAHVALLHDGKVLVIDGRLPELEVDEDVAEHEDERFTWALDLVAADVYLAPMLRVEKDRYLDIVGCRALPVPDGTWVTPTELADPAVVELMARTLPELDEPPTLRPAWFHRGWYDEVEAWVDGELAVTGRRRTGVMRVSRVWSISAVLRIPTDTGDVWFKGSCDLFRGEAGLHRVLAEHFPDVVPELIATDDSRGWLLMEPMRGAGESDRAPGADVALAARWGDVQLASLEIIDELLAAGAPLRGADVTVAGYRRVVSESRELAQLTPEERTALTAVTDEVEQMVHELWDCGLPNTLDHGDLHLGNVAYDGSVLRVFDLTDACVSHPILDGYHLAHFDDRRPSESALFAAFAQPWREAFPDAQVDRAAELAPVVNLAFQADTFHRIALATEPASAFELGGVVAYLLRKVPAAVAEARR
ncbi:aminoglycoside phosphotransferase family protein [Nocardioides sp.]|uniref:aminoglycoside phosphotransferase family protein n=1 Tax=Nocardioides sp. TaxID=35761 RepID=UPI002ED3772A